MKQGRLLRVLVGSLLAGCLSAPAQEAGAWRASSSTAESITGDIALSDEKLNINFVTFTMVKVRSLEKAELGAAFVQTFIRVREQLYSNLVGLHVTTGSLLTDQRLQDYAQAVTGRSSGTAEAKARATALLATAVQRQANVLAYIDGFMILGFAVIGALLLMLLLRTPPVQLAPPAAVSGRRTTSS